MNRLGVMEHAGSSREIQIVIIKKILSVSAIAILASGLVILGREDKLNPLYDRVDAFYESIRKNPGEYESETVQIVEWMESVDLRENRLARIGGEEDARRRGMGNIHDSLEVLAELGATEDEREAYWLSHAASIESSIASAPHYQSDKLTKDDWEEYQRIFKIAADKHFEAPLLFGEDHRHRFSKYKHGQPAWRH